MNKKLLMYTIAPALGLVLLGAGSVSALSSGGFQSLSPQDLATRISAMFQNEANVLGISVDAAKIGWAEGKTLQEIAQDNGISQDQLKQKLQAAHKAQVTTMLQTLVSQGVITQNQMNQRLAVMQNMASSTGNGRGHRHGMGMRFGFSF